MSFNKAILVGYVGRDPETRFTPNGNAACTFSVATTEKRKDEEVTTWFRCTAWGKSAENAQQWITKGRLVYIEGRLRLNEYTDKEGNHRASLEVNVSDWHLLDKREESARAATAGADDEGAVRIDPEGGRVMPSECDRCAYCGKFPMFVTESDFVSGEEQHKLSCYDWNCPAQPETRLHATREAAVEEWNAKMKEAA